MNCGNRKIEKRFIRSAKRVGAEMTLNRKRISEVLEATPEVRKDKIAELKKAITEGTYQVKADYIAEKILRELLFELARNLNNYEGRGYKNS